MKNSLLKRALAVAAAAPLALTQCLNYTAYAETVDTVAAATDVQDDANKAITLEDLLYIPANETVSKWNYTAASALNKISGTTIKIDVADYADQIIARAGENGSLAKFALDLVSDVEITLNGDLDVVVTGKIAEPDFNEIIKSELNNAKGGTPEKVAGRSMAPVKIPEGFDTSLLPEGVTIEDLKKIDLNDIDPEILQDLADKYGVPELAEGDISNLTDEQLKNVAQDYIEIQLTDIDFTGTEDEEAPTKVGGTFTLTIKGSDLKNGREVTAQFEYKLEDGTVYSMGELPSFAIESLEAIKAAGDSGIDKKFPEALGNALKTKYDEKLNKFISLAGKGDNALTKALSFEKSGKYSSVSAIISAANKALKNKGISKQLPATATDIAANSTVVKAFNKMVELSGSGDKIAITPADLGGFADSLSEIKGSIAGGLTEGEAIFPDAEQEEVKAWVESQGYAFVDSCKKITATIDFSGINTKNIGSVNVEIERILVTDTTTTADTTTTTTTTTTTADTTTESTTSSTSTESTTSTTESTTSTTSTESTTSTTESTTSTTSTETTTSTTSTESTTSTTESTTSTTSTESTTSTTESTTSTTSTESTTSSTSSETTSTSTETTSTSTSTGAVTTSYVRSYVTADTEAAYYVSFEDEFDKKAQVSKAILHVVYVEGYEGGTVSSEKELLKDITADIDFGEATPANTYDANVSDFAYYIPVYYNGEILKNSYGEDFTVTAYIALMGDVNLNNAVDANDASAVLEYYAKVSTNGLDPNRVVLSDSALVIRPTSVYDDFAAFLGDVFPFSDGSIDRNIAKRERMLDPNDASNILAYYAKISSTDYAGMTAKEIWEKVYDSNEEDEVIE